MKRLIILLLLGLALSCASAYAQDAIPGRRQVTIFFRAGNTSVDMLWNGNDKALPEFLSAARADIKNPSVRVDSVLVVSYTSPDGNRSINEALSSERAVKTAAYLSENLPGLGVLRSLSAGEDWPGFASYLTVHPDIPHAKRARDIIERTPDAVKDEYGHVIGSRKQAVMDVFTPREWEDLKVSVFPALRRAEVFLFYSPVAPAPAGPVVPVSPRPEVSVKEEPQAEEAAGGVSRVAAVAADIAAVMPVEKEEVVVEEEAQAAPDSLRGNASTAVLGTNLLMDALTVPNVALEFPFGRHWSVGGAVYFPSWSNWRPWWSKDAELFSVAQAILGNLQLSYYFIPWEENNNRVLRGPYLRLFGYAGPYTFEHRVSKAEGVLDKGNYFAAGAAAGAAIPLGQWLRLDLSVGFGPSWTVNTHYVNYDIQGQPIPVGQSTTLRWKAADAQVGVKYIFHKSKKSKYH